MGKIYCLIGRSSVGKDTIAVELEKRGFLKAVSFTTRPKRENEVDGIDYFFVTNDKFNKMREVNKIIESRQYYSNDILWQYGLADVSFNLKENDNIVVVDFMGYLELKKYFGEDVVKSIYVYVDNYGSLLMRSLKRQPNASKEQVEEICRRFLKDNEEMNEDVEKACDFKVNNENLEESIKEILEFVKLHK
ncbi:MAG: guanylate kinase [Clostridiaceae bacterium]